MDPCDRHTWAAVGVTTVADRVVRVWVCEVCQAWVSQPLEPAREVPVDEAALPTR